MFRHALLRSAAMVVQFAALAPLAGALPPSFPGSVDPGYGVNGVLALSVRSGLEMAYKIVAMPDGRFLVAGSAQTADRQSHGRYLARLTPDGRIDGSFGSQGLIYDNYSYRVLAVQPSGKILAASTVTEGGLTKAVLHRLLPDGSRDMAFGVANGETVISSGDAVLSYQDFEHFEIDAAGRIVITSRLFDSGYNVGPLEVWRLSSEGIPDTTFGTRGRSSLADAALIAYNSIARVQPDGKIVIAMWCYASNLEASSACVVRLNADGTRDTAFGPNGVRKYSPSSGAYVIYDLLVSPAGKIYVSGSNYAALPARAIVFGLDADGTPDMGWGSGGMATMTGSSYAVFFLTMHLAPDGRMLLGGVDTNGSNDAYGFVARLTADGRLDSSFGTGGVSARAIAARNSLYDSALLADGSVLVVGDRYNTPGNDIDVDSILVKYVGVETTTPVVEFYNSILNHYFITADPVEAAAIDGGSAGPGWSRTGKTWKSGGPSRVCRFYGSLDINPATGLRRGPNSHFYTIDPSECIQVRLDPGWHFESYDFSGWPKSGGACLAGTVPVRRVYNNRFAQNDSNHRYTTEQATYDAMKAQGWTGEETVFCAPQ